MIWGSYLRPSALESDPFGFFRVMNSELNRAIDAGEADFAPRMNIWANVDAATVSVELPGIDPSELELEVSGSTLSIKGRRAVPGEEAGKRLRAERRFGEFKRAVELPFNSDSEKVEAAYNAGVLTVKVPRAEADRPRRIAVRSNQG